MNIPNQITRDTILFKVSVELACEDIKLEQSEGAALSSKGSVKKCD